MVRCSHTCEERHKDTTCKSVHSQETLPLVDTPIINHLIWEATKAGVSRLLSAFKRKYEILSDFIIKGRTGDKIRSNAKSRLTGIGRREIIPHIQKSPGGLQMPSCSIESIQGPFLYFSGTCCWSRNTRPTPF